MSRSQPNSAEAKWSGNAPMTADDGRKAPDAPGSTYPDAAQPEDEGGAQNSQRLRRLTLLLDYARPYRGRVVLAVVALVMSTIASLTLVYTLQPLIDKGFAGGQAGAVDRYFLQLFIVAMVLALATAVRFFAVTTLGERVVADLRKAVYNRVVGLHPSYFEANRPGEIVSRLTADTSVIQTVVGSSVSIALRNILTFFGGVIMLFVTNAQLMATIAIAIPLVLVPIFVLGRRVRRLSRSSQDRIADLGTLAGETLGAINVVQAFTQEDRERGRFSHSVEGAYEAARQRIWVRSLLTAVVIVLVFGAIDFVLWQGAKDVVGGTMTGGQLAAFVAYAVLVAGAAGAIAEVYGDLQRAAGASGRLRELLKAEAAITAPDDPQALPAPVSGRVSFEDVTFRYPSRPDAAALDSLSIDIAPGETVAVVGPSGAGKSTLFQLILRFFDPQTGTVRLDGLDLRALDPADLRKAVAFVPQDTVIFADSVLENVRYGRPGASDAEVERALTSARADDFIRELPDGIHTNLGERGVRLSGGQRQRLAIARALLRDAPVLLLDEATSALDSETEKAVQAALDTLMAGRTTLIIAHRLATVRAADRIVVVDKGRVIALGSHEELLAASPVYRRLADLQFATQSRAAE
ncbi:ATP-binding cassette subfamily B protein [Rhodothalassium salexigens DSM 2132]|uniref:ATP-binding cassette subfamily B protein n=1 Tax=Rhodothalassium salexigens DSM 2132 TaxID=1188247 RepID=A0A4R2PW46_RHOSA|nr:ABC transporter transmembrane domain-containing protein [Rhodothalassium salexigens]MBB4210291.1 ATP-binding cassette subfamily B protein [Rhodothalassium salexigens DSM 2132]TCP38455.1 ATP-binding cassette subfamily B protein [Rhodothalassium salexigens DSM 2132]